MGISISFNNNNFGTAANLGLHLNPKINNSVHTAEAASSVSSLSLQNQENSAVKRIENPASASTIYEELYNNNRLIDINFLNSITKNIQSGQEDTSFADYIRAYSMDNSGNDKALSDMNVEGMVNTIGAMYASLSYQIENGNYSSQEKQKMQESLDSQLEAGIKDLADNFGQKADKLFSALGLDSETQNVTQSLTDLINNYKDKYKDFLNSEEGQDFIKNAQEQAMAKGTEKDAEKLMQSGVALAQALLKNEAEVRLKDEENFQEELLKAQKTANKTGNLSEVNKLQEAKAASIKKLEGSTDNNGFTLSDLSTIGKLQKDLNSFLNKDSDKSEEEIGYQLGLIYIKAQEDLTKGGASSRLTEMFNNNFDHFIDSTVNDINKTLEAKQDKADEFSNNTNPSSTAYNSLNVTTIMESFNNTVGVYNNTGNTTESVIQGFELAKNSYKANQNVNAAIRYTVGNNFFETFYNNNQKVNGNYNQGISNFRLYTNTFANS